MKRILFIIYFASFCCFSSAMAAIPNTEGLFRNPNNPDLAGNFVETKKSTISQNSKINQPTK